MNSKAAINTYYNERIAQMYEIYMQAWRDIAPNDRDSLTKTHSNAVAAVQIERATAIEVFEAGEKVSYVSARR